MIILRQLFVDFAFCPLKELFDLSLDEELLFSFILLEEEISQFELKGSFILICGLFKEELIYLGKFITHSLSYDRVDLIDCLICIFYLTFVVFNQFVVESQTNELWVDLL